MINVIYAVFIAKENCWTNSSKIPESRTPCQHPSNAYRSHNVTFFILHQTTPILITMVTIKRIRQCKSFSTNSVMIKTPPNYSLPVKLKFGSYYRVLFHFSAKKTITSKRTVIIGNSLKSSKQRLIMVVFRRAREEQCYRRYISVFVLFCKQRNSHIELKKNRSWFGNFQGLVLNISTLVKQHDTNNCLWASVRISIGLFSGFNQLDAKSERDILEKDTFANTTYF